MLRHVDFRGHGRSHARSLSVAVVLMLGALPGFATTVAAQPHDDCINARVIAPGALPFVDALPTGGATAMAADPIPSCGFGMAPNSVWYRYTASGATSLSISTAGSSYDTIVATYRGGCAAPVEISCADNTVSSADLTSRDVIPLQNGQTILMQVISSVPGGGNLVFAADHADPPFFEPKTFTEVLLSSDANGLGTAYGLFEAANLLSPRSITFAASAGGVFMKPAAGGLVTIALAGDPAPGGGTFSTFGSPETNDTGDVVFAAEIDGGPAREGIYRWSGGAISAVVVEGDLSPDGGTYTQIDDELRLNEVDMIAFRAETSASNFAERLFLIDGGVTSVLATENDLSPCGGLFARIGTSDGSFDLAPNVDSVAFYAEAGTDGVFLATPGSLSTVVCEGDPEPGGGTYDRLSRQVTLSDADVYFVSQLSGGAVDSALFEWDGSSSSALVEEGDVLGTGQTLTSIDDASEIDFGAGGHLLYLANQSKLAVVVDPVAGPPGDAIVEFGAACPLGGTFGRIVRQGSSISSAGDASVAAACGGGRGVFYTPNGGATVSAASVVDATTAGNGFRFFDTSTNAVSDSAFRGFRTGMWLRPCPGGVCGPTTQLGVTGAAAPGFAGQHISGIDGTTLNGLKRDQAVFGEIRGTLGYQQAILAVNNAVLSIPVSAGQALPGGVGTFSDFPLSGDFGASAIPATGRRTVAFLADLAGHPTAQKGLYASTNGAIVEIAVDGDLSPTGGTFLDFGAPRVRKKSILFRAETTTDVCLYGMRSATSPLGVIACEGDPAPAAVGGTISFGLAAPSGVPKAAIFSAIINGGSADECLLLARNGVLEILHCNGVQWVLGKTAGGFDTYGDAGTPVAEASAKGVVYMLEGQEAYELLLEGMVAGRKGRFFTIWHNRTVTPVAGGLMHYDPFAGPSMYKKTIAFASRIRDGSAHSAVFMATVK